MRFSIRLTPQGHLLLVSETDAPPLPESLAERLSVTFGRGAGQGLLHLGATEVATALPPVWAFWRDFAARYVTALTATPEDGEIRVNAPDAPALDALCRGSMPFRVERKDLISSWPERTDDLADA